MHAIEQFLKRLPVLLTFSAVSIERSGRRVRDPHDPVGVFAYHCGRRVPDGSRVAKNVMLRRFAKEDESGRFDNRQLLEKKAADAYLRLLFSDCDPPRAACRGTPVAFDSVGDVHYFRIEWVACSGGRNQSDDLQEQQQIPVSCGRAKNRPRVADCYRNQARSAERVVVVRLIENEENPCARILAHSKDIWRILSVRMR